MSDKDVLDRFIAKQPLTVITRCVVDSMITNELNAVFYGARSRQYEREQKFDAVALAVADIAMGFVKNPRQAFELHKERLGVSLTAFYGKLRRTEIGTSQAVVQHSAENASQLQDQLRSTHWEVIKGYKCFSFDGNHLQKTEKRLTETRGTRKAPLPGTVVAKFDMQRQLFVKAYMLEDAHAQESTVHGLLLEDIAEKEVLIGDRHQCVLKFLLAIATRKSFFVIRQHKRLPHELLGKRRFIGETETGKVYQQSIRIGDEVNGVVARRITVELTDPTKDGDNEIHILSNLPTKDVDACTLANAYRRRWEIENAFYHLTMSLVCESKALCYPKAALFLFAMAMVAFNCRQVLFAAMYSVHKEEEVNQMSNYQVATDVTAQMEGFMTALPKSSWDELVPTTPAARAKFLCRVAKNVSMPHYRKTVRGPKVTRQTKRKNQPHAHASVAKLLALRG